MKRPYSLSKRLITIVFVLSCMIGYTYADNEVYSLPWDGTTIEPALSGSTYTITTAEELAWLAAANDDQNGFKGKTIKLAANIDLNGSNRKRVWTPIGTESHPFLGTFDGDYHLIRGLGLIDTEDGIGIFGFVGREGLTRGKLKNVGISGGCLIAVRQRRVGALAGVCGGDIEHCWSMAEIAMSGNIAGGIVGEMLEGSKMSDVYCCGLIRNAGDTLGVLVGRNAGTLTRAYATGYAKNGCSFVGYSQSSASYKKCYFDRKLYYQEPGAVDNGLTPINNTTEMFDCMKSETSQWVTKANLYPQLKGFEGTDASRLSVAPVFVDNTVTNPINHANDLTVDFTVDIAGGSITWVTQELAGSDWIQFSETGDKVTVVRPCTESDVLATAKLRDEQKTVYFRARRVDDLTTGVFTGRETQNANKLCWKSEKGVSALASHTLARNGWGSHYYMVVRYGYNEEKELVPIDTLAIDLEQNSSTSTQFEDWFNSATILTDTAGQFVLRAFVHDERCSPEWMACEGRLTYTVLPELKPGTIPTRLDTFYLNAKGEVQINVIATTAASGGTGKITYTWRNSEDGKDIAKTGTNGNLTYTIKQPVTEQPFYRIAQDETDCDEQLSEGVYKVTVFAALDSGSIHVNNTSGLDKHVFCSQDDAEEYTIKASAAQGGNGEYQYQWYIQPTGGAQSAISGATNENLPLAGLGLTIGQEYTFVRMVKDGTRFTKWTQSGNKQTVLIAAELKPGTIPTRLDTVYLSSTGKATISVKAISAASDGSGTYKYTWRNSPDGDDLMAYGEKNGDLSYTLTSTGTYSFYRFVSDGSECGEKQSDGVYQVHVFDMVRQGKVNDEGKLDFCTAAEAQSHTITGTTATGGTGKYEYQWYVQPTSSSQQSAISGATDVNLPLSKVSLKAGETYTFVRKAKDNTRFTELMLSSGQQVIHIYATLDAGSIENEDRGRNCLTPAQPWLTVSVKQTRSAVGEGTLQYRWLRINGSHEEVIGTGAELSYLLSVNESNSYITYTYVREVKQANCDWVRSEGQISESYGIKTTGDELYTICVSQLPYTLTKNGQTHTFTTGGDDDLWIMTDDSDASGCPVETTVTVKVVNRPLISAQTEAAFCQNESNITISYAEEESESDIFVIKYSDQLAKYIGSKDTVGVITQPGSIVIRNVPPLPDVSDQYLDLQIGASGGTYKAENIECYSPITRINLVSRLGGYVHSKFSRVLYVDNNPNNGELPGKKLHFKSYQWYKNGQMLEGQTEQYYQENGNELRGTYYVRLTDDNGNEYRSCEVIMPEEELSSQQAPAAVYPVPVGAGEPLTITCYGGKANICSCTGETVLTTDCPSEQVTVSAPRTAGIYYVHITYSDKTERTEKLIVK